jgi:hypothetical protein
MRVVEIERVYVPVFFLTLITVAWFSPVVGQVGACPINGGPLDSAQWPIQAKCLLRTVKMNRELGPELSSLPAPLDVLVGKTIVVDKSILKHYLQTHDVDEARIGGRIDDPIVKARYFIIHDTSSPNLVRREFPPNEIINGPEWNRGRLNSLLSGQRTHVWVNRVGESATSRNYKLATLKTGVKLESRYSALRGLLLHNELIQPRRCNPRVSVCCRRDTSGEQHCNDAMAPEPGFSIPQLDRLALLYVAASTRRGQWLIPTFHGVIDDEFGSNAHDDPQHFDLNLWASRLQVLLNDLAFTLPR